VYLSGDSERELKELLAEECYVVGGLVDHNRHRGVSLERARLAGVPTARLPLDSVRLKSSCHLAVNHVLEILQRRAEGASWPECAGAIPRRKLES
jgi:tRNA (guanine9-N1)-methyltransferase